MRVLLVQSDDVEASSNVDILARTKSVTSRVSTASEALELLSLYTYDVAIIDRDLSDMDGFMVIRRARAQRITTPILMLNRMGDSDMTVAALRAGADDVLARPFTPDELIARIASIVRRSNGLSHSTLQIGPMTIDLDSHAVFIDGVRVCLTSKELAIIRFLALRCGKVQSKETMLNFLYDGLEDPGEIGLRVHIFNIRKKLAPHNADHLIETVWGRGYVMRKPAASATAAEPKAMAS